MILSVSFVDKNFNFDHNLSTMIEFAQWIKMNSKLFYHKAAYLSMKYCIKRVAFPVYKHYCVDDAKNVLWLWSYILKSIFHLDRSSVCVIIQSKMEKVQRDVRSE